jgi:hypothetical protein
MLNPLLPARADNAYEGSRAAPVILGVLLLLRGAIALGSMFNGYTAASSADGIPLSSYGAAATRTVLSLFALLGLANLVLCVVGIVVLVRYRSLVPLMFVLLLVQQLGRKLVLVYLPVERVGAPPGNTINLVILLLMIVGLALSLWRRPRSVSA